MTKKYKTLAYRVYARSKEISAHKGAGMSMAELQKQLGLEEVGYDTFRRHVRRIWENPEGAKGWTAPALAPVDPPKLAPAPPPAPEPVALPASPGQPPAADPASPPAPPETPAQRRKRRKIGIVTIGGEKLDLSPDSWKKKLFDQNQTPEDGNKDAEN